MNGKRGDPQQLQPPSPKDVEGRWGAWVMGTPVPPQAHHVNQKAATSVAVDYIPSAPIPSTFNDPNHRAFTSLPDHRGGGSSSTGSQGTTTYGRYYGHNGSTDNPYVQVSPVPGSSGKSPMEMILKVLGRCGKKLEDTTQKTGRTAGEMWHHLKTGPSFTDAAMTRLAQGTKVLAEGGHDKIFQQIFGLFPGEQLRKAYACYLSTSSGPVIGTLYVSTAKLAFCSDNPLCYISVTGQQEWTNYKVIVPLDQLRAANPSTNRLNHAEKYIQIVTADGHEFWFMGFVSYGKALKTLTEALQHSSSAH